MTKNQLYNLHTYLAIISVFNDMSKTSPDYIREKTNVFLGQLGKNQFIIEPKIFWEQYCLQWNVKKYDYELLNIFNFVLFSPHRKNKLFYFFDKYMVDINKIPDYNLKHLTHKKIQDYIDNDININSRFNKLKTL